MLRVELLPQCKLALLVWAADDSYSWVNTEVTNARCPQRMIDFYVVGPLPLGLESRVTSLTFPFPAAAT